MSGGEKTFVMIKPDGLQRGLVGKIMTRFEEKGLQLIGLKMVKPSDRHIEKHYEEHRRQDFYGNLVDYIASGPVVAMCWAGPEAQELVRNMVGPANPKSAQAGTIRGDFCTASGRNVVHSADSAESAERELALWFEGDRDIFEWEPALRNWIAEEKDDVRERREKHASKDRNGLSYEDEKRAEEALVEAERALKSIGKADLAELKAFHSPPAAVEDVASAVQILLTNSGRISRDRRSWKSAKIMMSDPNFINRLNNFDKMHINYDTVKALEPYLEDYDFNPDYIRKASAAAAALSTWVINMVRFYELIVEPRSKANRAKDERERRERRERTAVLP